MSEHVEAAAEPSETFEPMLEGHLVQISSIGPDTMCIPATLRRLRHTPTEGSPIRLLSIRRPNTQINRHPYVLVSFECTPFIRCKRPRGKAELGHERSCFIRDLNDATDPLFDTLSQKERLKIINTARLLYRIVIPTEPETSSR